MLSDVCRYAGAFFAFCWLSTSALAAPIVDFDDSAAPTVSPDSANQIDVIISSPSSAAESAFANPPPTQKLQVVNEVLNVAGVVPNAEILTPTQRPAFAPPIGDYSATTAADAGPRNFFVHVKLQELPAAPAVPQHTPNLIARQDSSPLIIATPEPSSIGLLLIASTTFLAARRRPRRRL